MRTKIDLWKRDACLTGFEDKYKDIQLFSFDIFDTLLFRSVAKPVDLFRIVAEESIRKGCLISELETGIFKTLRIKAEALARSKKNKLKGSREVNLCEIYDSLPKHIGKIHEIMNTEIDLEKKHCYLNPSIYSLICSLKKKGLKIILCSDMYLSKKIIEEILETIGFDLALADKIYISNEIDASKSIGSLYDFVLKDNNKLLPSEILHIGDNYINDVVNARSKCLHALYYNIVPGNSGYNIFELEEITYERPLMPELSSLRKLAMNMNEGYNEEEAFWFRIGAGIMGPILSMGCEWLLSIAERNKIRNVYPLMREGKILSELLEMGIMHKSLDINVKPLYVSRAATYLPHLFSFNRGMIDDLMKVKGMYVRDIFNILRLQHHMVHFVAVLDMSIAEIEKNAFEWKNKIINYLLQQSVIDEILKNAETERVNLTGYLEEFDFRQPYITFDLGYKGTIPSQLEEVIISTIEESAAGMHLMVLGNSRATEKIMKGINLSYLCDIDLVKNYFNGTYIIMEQLVMCEEGSTIGYGDKDECFRAKQQPNLVSPRQIHNTEVCKAGITRFYELLINSWRGEKEKIFKDNNDLPLLLHRLYDLPTYEEVINIKTLQNDENFGTKTIRTIIGDETVRAAQEMGLGRFLSLDNWQSEILWPAGVATLVDSSYLLKGMFIKNGGIGSDKCIIRIIGELRSNKHEKVLIYGAGDAGKRFYSIFKIYDIDVLCFIDGNKYLHNSEIDGIKILPLDEALQLFVEYPIVIGSFAYTYDIRDAILKAYMKIGKDAEIYCK